jgi:uncharacterized membrane protein
MEKERCHITKKEFDLTKLVQGLALKSQIISLIQKDYPDFSPENYISLDILNTYRKKYLESMIKKEGRELNKLEKEVLKAIHSNNLLSENIETEIESELTTGQRMADKIATFGGSWTFIIFFFSFLLIWMAINIWVLSYHPFDPFPFILLNLILSCLAAIQAPIIMMSQNRKEQKDRARSENDYKINLKAELEIRLLHEKLDHLIIHQNKRMLDIQELQLDYLEDISKSNEKAKE